MYLTILESSVFKCFDDSFTLLTGQGNVDRGGGILFPYFDVSQLMIRIILERIWELLFDAERARIGSTHIEFLCNW